MLSVMIAGIETSLDDGALCTLVGYDGWGMADQHRLSSRGPQQHGDTDQGYRLDPRLGKLILQLTSSTELGMYQKRAVLLGLFAPGNNPMLRWNLVTGERRIDCHYYDDLSLPWDVQGMWAQRLAVTLKCPDPTFYTPTGQTLDIDPGGGGTGLAVPVTVPISVGASAADIFTPANYPGTFASYPFFIRITGPITNPVITNVTTGEKLDFTGTTITAGHYYDIDCRYAYKTVTDDVGASQIAKLTDDSDLATFHIAAHPEAPGGINSIHVTGSAINAAAKVQMAWDVRYVGI